jgi:hypothetical protein
MQATDDPEIRFARLADIPPAEILSHMTDPRVAEHMPLLTGTWDLETVAAFVAAKEACWDRDGLGHWAFLYRGRYAGWGGLQREGREWDLGLVLKPGNFGLGNRILKQVVAFARADSRIPYVTFLLPPSRKHLGALSRIGATACGKAASGGAEFLKFRMETG